MKRYLEELLDYSISKYNMTNKEAKLILEKRYAGVTYDQSLFYQKL